MKRVVITGMGIYSCIGKNLEEVKNSLYQGKSGIIYDQERKDFGYRSPLTGMVETPNLKKQLTRRERISLGDEGAYAYVATIEALENAKLTQDYINKNEVGILYGNDSTAKAVVDSVDKIKEKKDTTLVGSGAIFQAMNSTVTMNLSTLFKLTGVNFTISAACASGSHAIGMAYQLIKSGLQDCIICGGAQEINKYAMGSFDGLGVFAMNLENPEKASRPFDKNRDGLVPSGGAATLIVESYESAVKRGAPILAEIIGYGFSSNGEHISTPNVDGPSKAMSKAIAQSNLKASDIEYVNAHATSTLVGDANEAKAIVKVFGENGPYVSSTKSMTGHECWMAGASEVIYSMLMMQNNFIAPNINLEEPDEDAKKLNLVSKTIDKKFDVFLSNSFGFGGTNSALIIKKL
ncbi:beta-ketoacyl synthase [Oceanihabitans sediminis]|uniref:3-oxoacyl-[acyl-carrier-protein] synthase 1 n=1 Tax=Oceanihabitans sediminis TaxID=1812012 RepID=A0A368P6P3_9FLAO|nr:beta-ketoacyl-[acyl-carrier-protein] synthase family protein [Oceanihabitans sediminis]MDX1277513.1 beta-ketoacyl-[acyl-carrier-protein] synthase family protein [Oceanihabitans sediminis]MDX1772854.1 beta-ketoacyl-[acyl-carrier-protein] synthase family protein [Oceanihabitans sediminis]RBP34532.1 3-oxoacyl-[acyl-carrier-protein] synthase-1 [Oceanihabitans sediminis]RCU58198.1 beta-ketoacyl-[acyl-carrier-protein] synthase family protein [Oceanihabitans sediminis]